MARQAVALKGADLAHMDGALTPAERLAAFAAFGEREVIIELTDAEREAAFLMFGKRAPRRRSTPTLVSKFPALTARGAHIDPKAAALAAPMADWLFVLVAAELAALWGAGKGLLELGLGAALGYVATAACLKLGLWLTDAYRAPPGRARFDHGFGGLALGAIAGLVLANIAAPDARGAAALAAVLPAAAILMASVQAALSLWMAAARRKGVFAQSIVIIGANDAARRLALRAETSGEARVVAIIDDRASRAPAQIAGAPVAGALADLLKWEGLPHIDRIVIAVPAKAEARVRAIIAQLRALPHRIDQLLDLEALATEGRRVSRLTNFAAACVAGLPQNPWRALAKRAFDIVTSGLLLAFLAPALASLALLVRADSAGPALYRQNRRGYNNRVFASFKFRTLRHDPGALYQPVAEGDPRLTRVGVFLRRTGLEDLPLLFNVWRGEMSLVGPRPHALEARSEDRALDEIAADYAHRHRVKPGLIGWAFVNGVKPGLETPAQVRAAVRFDLDYAQRASLWLDAQIIARAIAALFAAPRAAA